MTKPTTDWNEKYANKPRVRWWHRIKFKLKPTRVKGKTKWGFTFSWSPRKKGKPK